MEAGKNEQTKFIVPETGIPIPPRAQGGARAKKSPYPYKAMKINESFTIPKQGWRPVYNQITGYGKRNDKKFVFRTVSEDSMRVWRVQ